MNCASLPWSKFYTKDCAKPAPTRFCVIISPRTAPFAPAIEPLKDLILQPHARVHHAPTHIEDRNVLRLTRDHDALADRVEVLI